MPPAEAAPAPIAAPRPSKFAIPGLPPGFLRRQRLLDFLHQNVDRKLLLIAAAAGYGKTSLVADFAGDTEFPVVWLALDETDRDLGALATDLVAALRKRFPEAAELTRALLAGGSGVSAKPEQLAAALAADLDTLPGYFVLCLDDYHVVADSEPVGGFLTRLLNLLPEQAHLMITSRGIPPPPFPIVPLAARQEIAGLNEDQLRFTAAEIQALLQARNNVNMPADEAEQLAADTEGWITGILLSSHLMWQGLMASWLKAQQAGQPVYDYLADEVLGRLPPALRDFLVESAVLPEMDAEVCDAVLGRSDCGEMLRRADERRLFITSVGDEAPSFRYHQLFRDFLLNRLAERSPGRLRELEGRAARWYAQRGWPEAALTFYLAAGEIEAAAAIAEAHARDLFTAGRHETLRRWGEQLAAVQGDTPNLMLYQSKAQADSGNLAAAAASLEAAARTFENRADSAGRVAAQLQRSILAYRNGGYEQALALAEAAAAQAAALGLAEHKANADRYSGLAHFALGHLAAAAAALEQAVEVLGRTSQRYDQALSLQDLARVCKASGKTARAAQAQQAALVIWREQSRFGSLAVALNNLGWDKHMLGHYEDALATYAEALTLARRAGSGPAEILILTGQGDLLADLGDWAAAQSFYGRAIHLVESLQEVGYLKYLYQARARLERWAGNFAGALEWLRRAEKVPVSSQVESPGTNTNILLASIWMDLGRVPEAIELLEETCARVAEAGAIVDLAAGRFALARAYAEAGRTANALDSLRQAFELAEQVGYDQMLLVEASSAGGLLATAREAPALQKRVDGLRAHADAARSVLARLRAQQEAAGPRPAAVEVLALGGSRVRIRGREVARAEWASQQPREVFLFLVDRAPVRRDLLLETFWKNKTAARATANLHQALYQARRAVGHDTIVVEDGCYRLADGLDLEYDVARFEHSARSALGLPAGDASKAAALGLAANLFTGEYLADLPTEWAQERREQLNELHLELLRRNAEELYGLARFGEARSVAARALECDPCDDTLNELMLRCLASLGRRHEVVAHYQRYRERLRSELGLDPPAEIRELYARLIQ